MKKLLIPIVLLFLGVGGGVGAGLFLMPAAEETAAADPGECLPLPHLDGEAMAAGEHATPADGHEAAPAEGDIAPAGREYARLNNQFIVPVVNDAEVGAMVVLSISVEVMAGQQETVLTHEPKLRDVFLQVLFDHANTGGFEGTFTASSNMRTLRAALLAAAQETLGDAVTDVLIIDIVRQDA